MLTPETRMGRKCGNEPARKLGLGHVKPAFEPTPEKVRNPTSIPHLRFLSAGPNGSSRPLATLNLLPRSTRTALAPGILIIDGRKRCGMSVLSLTLSLSSLLSPRAFEEGSLGKLLENPKFGVMLDSDTVMDFPAI